MRSIIRFGGIALLYVAGWLPFAGAADRGLPKSEVYARVKIKKEE